jgi:hypothetical protein
MIETIEAIYEDGNIRLLAKPHVQRAKAIITFLEEVQPEKERIINIDRILGTPSRWDKLVGIAAGADADALHKQWHNEQEAKHQ